MTSWPLIFFAVIALVTAVYSIVLVYHWFKFTMKKNVVTFVASGFIFGTLLLLFILLMASLALSQ